MEQLAKRLRARQRALLIVVIICNAAFIVAMCVRVDHRRVYTSYVLGATSLTAVFVASRDHRRLRTIEEELRKS